MRDEVGGAEGAGRRGTTLVELVVVLAIVGVLFGISVLALSSLRPPTDQEAQKRLERARHEALKLGVAVMVADDSNEVIRFLPDGQVIGGDMDPLTGKALHDAR